MKRFIPLAAALGMGIAPAAAQVNATDAAGYLERGRLMLEADNNYAGCIDQLARLHSLPTTAAQREEALFWLGKATLLAGDDEALPILRSFIATYPVSPRRVTVHSYVGDYFFSRDEYGQAIAEYEALDQMALDSERQNEVAFRLGYSYMMLGEPETAEGYFRQLQGKEGWRDAAGFYLGYIAYQQHEYAKALRYFREVNTAEAPGNAAPYYIAQIDFAEGRYREALDGARSLLASGSVPAFTAECNRLAGESLYNLGHRSDALPYLWKYCAEAKEPAPSAYYILGISEYDKGDTDASVKLLQQAIGQHSAMEQSAWLYLGQAYMKRGDKSSALMAFENAYRMDNDPKVREVAFYNYAVARLDGGRAPFGNSVGLLEDFLKDYPNSAYAPEVQRYIVEGYMTGGDYEGALAAIAKVKNPTPQMLRAKQRALFVVGTREYAAGRVGDAITHLTEAKAIRGGDAEVSRQCDIWLGDCRFTRGDYEGAARDYKAFLAATPATDISQRALALYDLGYTRFNLEQYAEAMTDFNQAADLARQLPEQERLTLLPDILTRQGDCLYYLQDYAKAEAAYADAYRLSPTTADYALFQQGMMKGLQKDYAGKISLIDRLMATFPSSGLIPTAMLEKAESQSATGQTQEAIKTYNELVRQYQQTAPGRNGYLQLAITYINSGQRAKGIDTYKKVIYTFPSSEEARIAADDLKQIYAADGKLPEFVSFINSVPNAPRFAPSELDEAAWQAAENAYMSEGSTTALSAYVTDWPEGASRAQALYYLAEAAWNAGDSAKAQGYAAQVILGSPDSDVAEDALLIKAKAEAAMGKMEIANKTFKELESKASGANMLREARMGVMQTAADLGRYADVVNAADKLLASTAANSSASTGDIRFARAMANSRLGNHDAAYADWEALESDLRDLNGAKSAYYHAQSLLDRGKTAQAETVADRLISSDTPQAYWLARGFILYSDILRKQGKAFEANEYLKSLRSNYPGTEADIFEMIDSRIK